VIYAIALFVAKIATKGEFLKQGIVLHPGPKISGGLSPAILS
jgi:hypothetical protein